MDTQKRDAVSSPFGPPPQETSPLEQMDFDDFVAESDVPILVDFYAPWCGPCQLMSKVVTVSPFATKMHTTNYIEIMIALK